MEPHPLLRKAVAALNAGQPAVAFETCSTLLGGAPDDPALNELAALAAQRMGRADAAKALALRSLDGRPNHVSTLIVLGRAHRALGEDADAVAAFRQAGARAPDRAEPAFLLGATLLKLGKAEAQKLVETLASRFSNEAAGWEEVGQVLLDLGKREAALVCFRRADIAAPSLSRAVRCGMVLKDLGRAGEAACAFARAVALDGSSARAWFLLGLCSGDAGDRAGAAKAYRAALALEPGMAEAAVNLGTLLQEGGDLDGAKRAYGQAIRTRADTFGRVAQAMTTSPKGELWLDLEKLRRTLAG